MKIQRVRPFLRFGSWGHHGDDMANMVWYPLIDLNEQSAYLHIFTSQSLACREFFAIINYWCHKKCSVMSSPCAIYSVTTEEISAVALQKWPVERTLREGTNDGERCGGSGRSSPSKWPRPVGIAWPRCNLPSDREANLSRASRTWCGLSDLYLCYYVVGVAVQCAFLGEFLVLDLDLEVQSVI